MSHTVERNQRALSGTKLGSPDRQLNRQMHRLSNLLFTCKGDMRFLCGKLASVEYSERVQLELSLELIKK